MLYDCTLEYRAVHSSTEHSRKICTRVRLDNVAHVLYYPWCAYMRVGGTHYACVMFIISEDLNLAMF